MKPVRPLSRRSFLGRVVGGAVAGGGAILMLSGKAEAFQVTDADSAPNADPPGRGRGQRRATCTDSDSGPNSDGAGRGRGNGVSDNDAGANADAARCGRGPAHS